MPRIPVLSDTSVVICDTASREDGALVVIRNIDATVVFWSQERSQLDSNVDASNVPQGGLPMINTDPPLVFIGLKAILWARASTKTFLQVEVMEMVVPSANRQPRPSVGKTLYQFPQGPLPGDGNSGGWFRKLGL